MAIIHARRMRLPRPHEAVAPARPTLHIIIGGRRQLLSGGKRVAPSSQTNAPAGYGMAPRGVGYSCATTETNATFPLPTPLAIGTGDFTIFLHYHVHTTLNKSGFNYLFGSSATYLAVSAAATAESGNLALVTSSARNSGIDASAAGEYRVVVRRVSNQIFYTVNGVEAGPIAETANPGSLTYISANAGQTGGALGAAGVTLYLAGIEASAWSDAEVSAYTAQPERVFAPIEDDRWFDPLIATSGGGTISINEIAANRVFEGADGSAQVTISGTHTGTTDTIEYRIETTAGAAVTSWANLQTAVAEGAFSGTVTVPRGGWYYARVRKASSTTTLAAQTQQWGVGIIVGGMGQSQIGRFTNLYTYAGTPDPRAVIHDGTAWSLMTATGSGRNTFAAQVIAAADCPVALIVGYADGAEINNFYDNVGGKLPNYTSWESKVTAAGGALSAMIWWQGEGDVYYESTKAQYAEDVYALLSQLRADYGASLPIVLPQLGRTTYEPYTDESWEQIRDVQVEVSRASALNYGISTIQFGIADIVHYNDAAFVGIGQRIAQCVAHALGLAAYARSPRVASATRVNATTIDVSIAHEGGTDIAPSTGITGFSVLDNGVAVTISSAVRQSANTVRLTLSAPLVGPVAVRYGYGKNPVVSGILKDNTALALALETTDADVLAAGRRVVLDCIQREGGAPAASVTGLRWAFFDQSAPNALTAPAATGTGELTDGSGVLEIDVLGTSLGVGDTGYLVTDTAAGVGFCGPVQVSG